MDIDMQVPGVSRDLIDQDVRVRVKLRKSSFVLSIQCFFFKSFNLADQFKYLHNVTPSWWLADCDNNRSIEFASKWIASGYRTLP